ncbi:hypothetical protein [Nonomuraea guangzhouensis]|uniref:Cytochrome P450 n=1 Tax=Nonomuraea guangzhouensis TaxID=1291555 RepID=A0ABW4GFQ3_9ACTN|nr:hypothetical protein [Nonomuraea guangzhouensis]
MTSDVPQIDLTDPGVSRDPFTAYGRARELAPIARVGAPGFGTWRLSALTVTL